MQELVWLDSALNDLVRLREFVAQENPGAARRIAETIQEAVQRLISFPDSGKPVKELIHYRDLFIRFGAGGYVVRYRIYCDVIYIVYIKHYREVGFKAPE